MSITEPADRRLSPALAASASSTDPAEGLRAVVSLRLLCERLEQLHVARARGMGWSWQEIAAALGVSKQAVHKKHSRFPTPETRS